MKSRLSSTLALLAFPLALFGCGSTPQKTAEISAPPNYKSASEIPVEEFFRNPAVAGINVSPDGTKLLMLKAWKNRLNVFVQPVGAPNDIKQITFVEDRDVAGASWKGSNTILVVKDVGGDENFHLLAVNLTTGDTRDLLPAKGSRTEIISGLEESSATDVWLGNNQRDKEIFDAYRINVETGEIKQMVENKLKISAWLIDHNGNLRGGSATDGVNSVFYFEKEKGKPFAPIFKTDFRVAFQPVAMTADNQHVFVYTNYNRDLTALVEVDPLLPSAKMILKTVYSHPNYDMSGADYSPVRKTIGSVQVITDREEVTFLNPDDQKDLDLARSKAPGQSVIVANSSIDEQVWVLRNYSDRSRGGYSLFDRRTKQLTNLGEISPWLPVELMSEMKTINYKTRDGLNIQGYLTLPRGIPAKNLPVVVNPHGGPWARDQWRFDAEAQFLASRGYAVFQMNFRGSTGYGRKFWEASFKQWGKKMQNDVTDGTQWLIKQGIADKKRIAIYGGSYGGYATLAGVAFTPNLYACAVDYVGVANLFTFMNTIPPYWKPYLDMFHQMVGDPIKDKTLLASASPVLHAEKIKAPLFVAQGANDPRVNKNESDQMVEALKKRGVAVEYMVKDNEGHGFHNEENRFDFYRAMDKFLAKHLKGSQGV